MLGIDVGTTGTKTLLFCADGELIGQAYRSYDTTIPQVGWSEQDPQDWWNAVVDTVRQLCADREISENVAGISLSVQGGTMLAVDSEFEPLRPAVVWNDRRCSEQKESFLREVGDAQTIYEKTGWKLGLGLNALQIRWMKENEPELFEKTAMFMSVPDYISYKMTGVAAIDLSNAGINQLCNIADGRYDPVLLAFAGITEEKLPKICRAGEAVGYLTEKAAEELGLTTKAVFCAGVHDQYAVALGAGACQDGDILIGSGTCWVITCIKNNADFASGLSQSVAAVPNKWGSLWSLSSGGVCLEWMRKNIMLGVSGEKLDYGVIDSEVEKRKAAEEGLYFYPFAGRSTNERRFQRGSFTGLDLSHDRFHLARAVEEGVAFQIVWMLDAFNTKPSKNGLIFAGGASKSEVWVKILADIANMPIRIPAVADLACVGAAILAGVGCGIYKDAAEGYKTLAAGERTVYPDSKRSEMYSVRMKEYKKQAAVMGEDYRC